MIVRTRKKRPFLDGAVSVPDQPGSWRSGATLHYRTTAAMTFASVVPATGHSGSPCSWLADGTTRHEGIRGRTVHVPHGQFGGSGGPTLCRGRAGAVSEH